MTDPFLMHEKCGSAALSGDRALTLFNSTGLSLASTGQASAVAGARVYRVLSDWRRDRSDFPCQPGAAKSKMRYKPRVLTAGPSVLCPTCQSPSLLELPHSDSRERIDGGEEPSFGRTTKSSHRLKNTGCIE